jgi:signal transduction histidine kinase
VRIANHAAETAFDGALPLTGDELRGRFVDAEGNDLRDAAQLPGTLLGNLRGTTRWFELNAYPVIEETGDTNDVASTIIVLRDVTELRRVQELREAFIGVLSHELRTPITTIFGGSRVLARPALDEATRRDVATDVVAEAERLHRLVEDLLVLARAERGALELGGDPVLLQHLIPRVVRSESVRWPEVRFVERLTAAMPAVAADETYVEQIVRNLLANAAKYGGPGTVVELVAEPSSSEIVVRVLDDGPGVGDDEDRLFDLFYRAPATAAKSGAGIGLFVCRALAEAMGGRIWAGPRPEGGAEFGFTLPIYAEDAA